MKDKLERVKQRAAASAKQQGKTSQSTSAAIGEGIVESNDMNLACV